MRIALRAQVAALGALLVPLAQLPGRPQDAPALALTHVTVIDCTGGRPKTDHTVIIVGDRITQVGKSSSVKVPPGSRVVDLTGKFLIPGLWDMHVHLAEPGLEVSREDQELFLRLLVANGVTGIRDMHGDLGRLLHWRREIEAGTRIGPRMIVAGRLLDGLRGVNPGSIPVETADEGREAVKALKRSGADFVKVYSLLPRAAYFAITDEAQRQELPFAGHVPVALTPAEASDAGQRSIEHLTGVLQACSLPEAERKAPTGAGSEERPSKDKGTQRFRTAANPFLDNLDRERAGALFNRFARNGTWHVPTLVQKRAFASIYDASLLNDPRTKYIPHAIRENWNPRTNRFTKGATPEAVPRVQALFTAELELVGIMRRAGVRFMAGTDTAGSIPYVFPGFSLHDELALLVEAGLQPVEALQAATRNPAEFLRLQETLGTVERGKMATLVLLDADPLIDIRNTRKVSAVVLNGKLVDRSALDQMLAEVAATVGRGHSRRPVK